MVLLLISLVAFASDPIEAKRANHPSGMMSVVIYNTACVDPGSLDSILLLNAALATGGVWPASAEEAKAATIVSAGKPTPGCWIVRGDKVVVFSDKGMMAVPGGEFLPLASS